MKWCVLFIFLEESNVNLKVSGTSKLKNGESLKDRISVLLVLEMLCPRNEDAPGEWLRVGNQCIEKKSARDEEKF
jgi:hypothetical protein